VWSPVETSGVSREVTEYKLNIKPGSKPIKQGLRRFNQEKCWAIGEELSRLLAIIKIGQIRSALGCKSWHNILAFS
jgi:hypothetical protein